MKYDLDTIKTAASFIEKQLKGLSPSIGLILGSGLGALADEIRNAVIISYDRIPGFPVSKVAGHAGRLVCGELEGKNVMVMQGRFHFYEGHDIQTCGFPVRVMKLLGVETLIVTNAAGGVNEKYSAGDLMIINDHINFSGTNPLMGKNEDELGPRFPDTSKTYTPELIALANQTAQRLSIPVQNGVYQFMTGPTYETPAEVHMARALGADAIGMSTFPETLTAAHCGMKALGISYIANMAAGMTDETLHHEDVMKTMDRIKDRFISLMLAVVSGM